MKPDHSLAMLKIADKGVCVIPCDVLHAVALFKTADEAVINPLIY